MKYQTQQLVARISADLGDDHHRWFTPRGYQGLACAVLDAIYSTGNHYSGVQRLITRYVELRSAEGADASSDTSTELVDFIGRCGGAEAFAGVTGYKWRAWPRTSAPLKAQVALEAASLLEDHGIDTVDSLQAALSDRSARECSEVAAQWHELPGQRSGLTWNYLLMLSGLPGVKADRMIRRYVSRALGQETLIDSRSASRAVEKAGDALAVHYTTLDHSIWRFESGRAHLQGTSDDHG